MGLIKQLTPPYPKVPQQVDKRSLALLQNLLLFLVFVLKSYTSFLKSKYQTLVK